jgi:N-acetylglucosaminyl-diphospho-decaprenol L-rhamnosyltransferase
MQEGMARLAIILVTYNSRAELPACLGSLRSAPPATPHEIVLVDNASSDGTPDLVRTDWPGVRLVEPGENLGFAAANNLAIRQTQGELVLLLNPDTIVPPGSLDTLVRTIEADDAIAIAGPRIVDGTGRPELSFGPMVSPWGEVRQKILVRAHERGIPPVTDVVERLTRASRTVAWVSGACLLARRRDLEAVGLMDERYFMYLEDVDLCAAVRDRGRLVRFVPEATVVHLRGRSRASAPCTTSAAYRRSQLAFYRKHHPRWAPVLRAYLRLRGRLPHDPPSVPVSS